MATFFPSMIDGMRGLATSSYTCSCDACDPNTREKLNWCDAACLSDRLSLPGCTTRTLFRVSGWATIAALDIGGRTRQKDLIDSRAGAGGKVRCDDMTEAKYGGDGLEEKRSRPIISAKQLNGVCCVLWMPRYSRAAQDRKAELAKKKAKLEELRKQREERTGLPAAAVTVGTYLMLLPALTKRRRRRHLPA